MFLKYLDNSNLSCLFVHPSTIVILFIILLGLDTISNKFIADTLLSILNYPKWMNLFNNIFDDLK